MGDLIGNSVLGSLVYIPEAEYIRVSKENIPTYKKISIFSDMCRLNTLYMIALAGSGHIGSSFSSLDIFSWLLCFELEEKDIFFSSKGHDAPGYYSAMMGVGRLSFDLIHKLRRINGLPGHPDVGIDCVETNTGSLGMGVSKAKGMVYANRLKGENSRVFVITGDGELQEGQFWESLISASNNHLNEITVIVDHNKLQSDGFVKNVSDLGNLERKIESFGWCVSRCDGNSIEDLVSAYNLIRHDVRPKCIIADTIKGKGVSFMEHTSLDSDVEMYKFHSGSPDANSYTNGVTEILRRINGNLKKYSIEDIKVVEVKNKENAVEILQMDRLIDAYSKELVLHGGKNDRLIALDADLILDTGLIEFKKNFPERFIECGIAEQDMVSVAGGLALKGYLPIVHSFSCFLSARPNEQIYNNSTEKTKIIYVGSLAGVLPAGPGHSHQAIRDISALSAVPNLIILSPSNNDDIKAHLDWAINMSKSSVYLRIESTPFRRINKTSNHKWEIGKGKQLKTGKDLTVLAYGPTILSQLYEAVSFIENNLSINIAIVEMPWLNLIDREWFMGMMKGVEKFLIIDNHYVIGGLADRVSREICESNIRVEFYSMGIKELPPSGSNLEVLDEIRLSANAINEKIKSILKI